MASTKSPANPQSLLASKLPKVIFFASPNFILGTVAIEIGEEIWVGGIGGSNRIARFEYR